MENKGELLLLLMVVVVLMVIGRGEGQLVRNFYSSTCPWVEPIVRDAVKAKLQETPMTVPGTLRLFFHDCFVQGCDASIMIVSPDGNAEKDAPDNLTLDNDGFDTIIKAKQVVEAACPGVVSCADILAMAARDVVLLSGGPWFDVELGRRDGLISKASLVAGNIPEPDFDLNLLSWIFRKNNLNMTDMIALAGAHTVGFSHCTSFSKRLYSFNSTHPVDPSMNPAYAKHLMQECPQNRNNANVAVNLDPTTPNTFDNAYYKNLVNGEGLFSSDQSLFTDPLSKSVVKNFASNPFSFGAAFAQAMVKLGRVGVKTGNQGEIRIDCTTFN